MQLLGFPIQLLGLLTLPYLGVRYYVDKTSKPADDFSSAAVSQLPAYAQPALLRDHMAAYSELHTSA